MVFVPCTPRGELTKLLQAAEDKFSSLHGIPRVRYVEMGGSKMADILCRKNPWKGAPCGREKCWPCQGDPERAGNCQVENVTYSITCVGCSQLGVTTTYTGETSRNMYCRGLEHHQALLNEAEDSVLWNHCQEVHGGNHQDFHMVLIRRHKSAFARQVSEGVEIEWCEADLILMECLKHSQAGCGSSGQDQVS